MYTGILAVFETSVLPAVIMLDAHSVISEDVWSVLSHVPYADRYAIYGRCYSGAFERHTSLAFMKWKIVRRTRYLMKSVLFVDKPLRNSFFL